MPLPLCRLLVGLFAGALAAFFPRLMAVLAGSPTDEVQLFSKTYLLVGCLVAVAVAVVIMIIENEPTRPMRDVFMAALGVPTLLMGAIGTSATAQNVAQSQHRIEQLSQELAKLSDIPIHADDSPPPAPATGTPASAWLQLLPLPSAQAQGMPAQAAGQSQLGIASQEKLYVAVLQQSAKAEDLRRLQAELQRRGIATQLRALGDGQFALLSQGPAKPMSEAVLDGVRAKNLGAKPFLISERAAKAAAPAR